MIADRFFYIRIKSNMKTIMRYCIEFSFSYNYYRVLYVADQDTWSTDVGMIKDTKLCFLLFILIRTHSFYFKKGLKMTKESEKKSKILCIDHGFFGKRLLFLYLYTQL